MTAPRDHRDFLDDIVHGYFGIDDTILYATIEADLKPLLPQLEALARQAS